MIFERNNYPVFFLVFVQKNVEVPLAKASSLVTPINFGSVSSIEIERNLGKLTTLFH